jgi:hypothetical protein
VHDRIRLEPVDQRLDPDVVADVGGDELAAPRFCERPA